MNQIAMYDFTIKAENLSVADIKKTLKGYAKKWVFQLERGDSGYEHYQGRFSLIKKRRQCELVGILAETPLKGLHLSPTHDTKSFKYVIKEDTKIDGPWADTDEEERYIPRQIRELPSLHPWQNRVIELSKLWDTRTIHIIIDEAGNHGKSTLCTYMGVHGLARTLPFVNDYKDIMRMVMDMPTSGAYIIDMPRAISKDKLFQMYAGIETIKSGYAYDDRYSFKDKYFDCPNVFVFTNKEPDYSLLSADRWRCWTIRELELVAWDVVRCEILQQEQGAVRALRCNTSEQPLYDF